MSKIFQPKVKEIAKEIIDDLTESGFFAEYEIINTEFANEYLCEKLTEKFIIGELDLEEALFDEPEFTKILQEIIAGSLLTELKKKGYINSYEDENTEELFFLTEEGKKYVKDNIGEGENPPTV